MPASCIRPGWALGLSDESLTFGEDWTNGVTWIDWPKGTVGGGGEHFLCVLMDSRPAEQLRLLAWDDGCYSQSTRLSRSQSLFHTVLTPFI